MANDALARLRAAQGYADLGMVDAAWRELKAIGDRAQRHLDLDVLQTEIVLLIKQERWQEGFDCTLKLLRLKTDCPAGFVHGAFCLHELGRTEEARELLRSGPAKLRKEAVYHYNLACYRAVLGNRKSARKSLRRAIQIDPSYRYNAKNDPDLKTLRTPHSDSDADCDSDCDD